jgi:hypothetical protein
VRQAGIKKSRAKAALRLSVVAALALAGRSAASEEPPLKLTVRPSGYDASAVDARTRQERLLQRMQENDFLFRNICVQCGGGVNKPGAYAPFNPLEALPGPRMGED